MAAEIKRGSQIGGCIMEIWNGRTCILIGFGEELPVRSRDACRVLNQYIQLGLMKGKDPLVLF